MFVHAVVIAEFCKVVVLDKESMERKVVLGNKPANKAHTHTKPNSFTVILVVLYSLLRCYNLLVLTGKAKRQPPKKV